MSSLTRPLAGPMLTFDLEEQVATLRADEAYLRTGRAGRTLAKSGRLRLTLVALAVDVSVGTHHADSPLTIHVLHGRLAFRMAGRDRELRRGEVLYFGPGDAHDIRAREESAFLLTISAIGDDYGGGAGEV